MDDDGYHEPVGTVPIIRDRLIIAVTIPHINQVDCMGVWPFGGYSLPIITQNGFD